MFTLTQHDSNNSALEIEGFLLAAAVKNTWQETRRSLQVRN